MTAALRRARRAGLLLGLVALVLAPLSLPPSGPAAGDAPSWSFSLVPRPGWDGGTARPEQAGNILPVEFSVGGYRGRNVLNPEAPISIAVDCDSRSPRTVASPPSAPARGVLTYDSHSDSYTFWWPRADAWVGTCRRLILKLGDGTVHPVLVYFGKTHTAILP